MKKPLIVLTGPTAVGKTELSIGLAKAVNGAIISADSIQVYKYMDIGSAKITPDEMQGIKHYLVDCLDPLEPFDVATFQKMAKNAMNEIYANGQIPIIVGGTGFYIQSVVKDIEFETEDRDDSYRKELERFVRDNGEIALHEMLREIDPEAADEIHANNVKRVIRAIEFYHKNEMKISEHNKAQKAKPSPYNYAYFVLNDKRETLYERIDKRVDIMVERGLVDEVQRLKNMGYSRGLVSMQGLGYKEIMAYLDGECSLDEAINIIKRDTRHFAKRQLTWFRREQGVNIIAKDEFDHDNDRILAAMLDILKNKQIV